MEFKDENQNSIRADTAKGFRVIILNKGSEKGARQWVTTHISDTHCFRAEVSYIR